MVAQKATLIIWGINEEIKVSEFREIPVIVEAITFGDFVQYGIEHTKNLVNGEPWSFDYKGFPITHETDECYLVPSKKTKYGICDFTPDDVLVLENGELVVYKKDEFESFYEAIPTVKYNCEYIRREDVLAKTERVDQGGRRYRIVYAKDIEAIPAVFDVVKVTRCKYCELRNTIHCAMGHTLSRDDLAYCNYGVSCKEGAPHV